MDSETFLQLDEALFNDLDVPDKLKWFSCLIHHLNMRELNTSSIESVDLNFLFDISRKTLLSTEDRYLKYMSQKVFILLMKLKNMKEGVIFIEECLLSSSDNNHSALEVCTQLLSKQNPHCHSFLCDIVPALQKHCLNGVPIILPQDTSNNQYLFLLSSVFIKISKLGKLNDSNALECIQFFISNCGSHVIDILFREEFMYFAKRRLLKLVCVMIRICLMNIELNCDLSKPVILFCKLLLSKLPIPDLSRVMVRNGQTSFVGTEAFCQDKGPGLPDILFVREWTFLFLNAVAFCSRKPSDSEASKDVTCEDHIQAVDCCVKEALKMQSSFILPWLAQVFGDQDDMWIEVLLLMFDIDADHSRLKPLLPHVSLPHHLYFLQFVSSVGYDHLVIVDLLTSPETPFLSYLIKYLKYTISHWSEFVEMAADLQNILIATTGALISIRSDNEEDAELHDEVEEELKNRDNDAEDDGDSSDGNEKAAVAGPKSYVIDDMCRIYGKNDSEECIVGNKKRKTAQNENLVRNEAATVQPSRVSEAMSLLMNAYDSSDSDSDGEDAEITESSKSPNPADIQGTKQNIDVNQAEINGSENIDIGTAVEMQSVVCNVMGIVNDSFDEKEECVVDNVIGTNGNNCDDENRGHFLDNVTEMEVDDCAENEEQLSEKLTEIELDECLDIEEKTLDKVMGMLIRVGLQLERLWNHGILQYNPETLLTLLDRVEEKYEVL